MILIYNSENYFIDFVSIILMINFEMLYCLFVVVVDFIVLFFGNLLLVGFYKIILKGINKKLNLEFIGVF